MKILFYVNNIGPPDKADYQHCIIALAEGFKALNIDFDSNTDYYKINNTDEYLFKKKENFNHDEYDYIITSFSCGIIEGKRPYPNKNTFLEKEILLKLNRKYKTILLDWSDGFATYLSNYKYYDYYFCSSYNTNIMSGISKNIYPFVFNSTNRIIEACVNNIDFKDRKIDLFYSHRVPHSIRGYMLDNIYSNYKNLMTKFNDNFENPNINDKNYIHWHQSGRRHNVEFYNNLKDSKMVDCTGGYLTNYNNNLLAYQIDSFKLWEAFFSGCCVLFIDLDKFNITFPKQPINFVHYIGFTLNKSEDIKIMNNIVNNKINIQQIAKNGYEFVNKYYTPKGIAEYILNIIK